MGEKKKKREAATAFDPLAWPFNKTGSAVMIHFTSSDDDNISIRNNCHFFEGLQLVQKRSIQFIDLKSINDEESITI